MHGHLNVRLVTRAVVAFLRRFAVMVPPHGAAGSTYP